MSYLEEYYSKMSVEREEQLIDEACQGCREATLPPKQCKYFGEDEPSYAPYYEGRAPAGSNTPFDGKSEEYDYRCWVSQPKLNVVGTPTGFRGDQVVAAAQTSECVRCRAQERMRLQTNAMVKPDYRFWIGVSAATIGVLAAVTVGISRR